MKWLVTFLLVGQSFALSAKKAQETLRYDPMAPYQANPADMGVDLMKNLQGAFGLGATGSEDSYRTSVATSPAATPAGQAAVAPQAHMPSKTGFDEWRTQQTVNRLEEVGQKIKSGLGNIGAEIRDMTYPALPVNQVHPDQEQNTDPTTQNVAVASAKKPLLGATTDPAQAANSADPTLQNQAAYQSQEEDPDADWNALKSGQWRPKFTWNKQPVAQGPEAQAVDADQAAAQPEAVERPSDQLKKALNIPAMGPERVDAYDVANAVQGVVGGVGRNPVSDAVGAWKNAVFGDAPHARQARDQAQEAKELAREAGGVAANSFDNMVMGARDIMAGMPVHEPVYRVEDKAEYERLEAERKAESAKLQGDYVKKKIR